MEEKPVPVTRVPQQILRGLGRYRTGASALRNMRVTARTMTLSGSITDDDGDDDDDDDDDNGTFNSALESTATNRHRSYGK